MKLTRVIKILIIASDIIIIIAFMKWRWLNMVNELSQNDQHKIFDQVMSALNENYYNQSGHPMLAGTTQAEDTFNPGNVTFKMLGDGHASLVTRDAPAIAGDLTVTVPTFSLNVEKVGGSIDYSTGLYSNEDIDFEDLAVILKVIVEPVASRMGQEYLINIPERTITYKGYAANNISIKEVLEYEIDTDTGFVESPIVPEDVDLPKYVIFEAAVREIRQSNIASISVEDQEFIDIDGFKIRF